MLSHLYVSSGVVTRSAFALLMLVMSAVTPAFAAAATVITWDQPSPITYGTPISTPATATAGGVPVAGTFTYDPPLGTVLSVGTRRITATFRPASGGTAVTSSKNVRVNRATLRVTSTATKVYGAPVPTLTPTYIGFVNGDTAASVLSGSPLLSTTATSASNVGSYTITVQRGSLPNNTTNYSLQFVNGTLTVTPASAAVTLTGLSQTYTGGARVVTATTTPSGLATSVTYNGSSTAPINAGSYAVVATVTNMNYTGSASGTLVVAKAPATVTLGGLAQTYTGTARTATATTAPGTFATTFTYDGAATAPINAGSYAVVATVNDTNYAGSASGTLVVSKATATVTLGGLTQTYTGAAKSATVTTVPAGLAGSITYNGAATLPINAGTYAVVATVNDTNYAGSATDDLTITPATADVAISDLAHVYDGAAHAATITTTPAGLAVLVSYNSNTTAPVNAGSYDVIATIQDPNYTGTANDQLVITKANATVTLADLDHTYDGLPHAAAVTTTPAGLAVTVTYAGDSTAPTAAGSYAVVATITDANHQGDASGSLTIGKAAQTITMAPLADVMVGDPDQVFSASATSGLAVDFSVTGPAEVIGNALRVTGAGAITITATQAGDANWLSADPIERTITAVPETGGGLIGSYFANQSLSGSPVLTRTDTQVNFDWASGSPAPGTVPTDRFSVRWDGEIVPRFNESYTLTFRTDDGVRVWFDGLLIVNSWNDRSAADSTYTFAAEAGRHYRIRMEYYENGGLAVARLLWRSASEPFGPVPKRQLHPVPPDTSGPIGTGTGLTASYFANETLAGVPAVSRVDATVNFDWAGGSPAASVPADSFSARWTGDIQTRYTEAYTLILRTDDGVRMWIDDQLVINDWILRGAANSYYTFNAEAGRRYRIHIEYYEHFGSAVAQLQWYSAREFFGAVPATQLYPLPTPVIDIAEATNPLAEGETVALHATISDTGSATMAYAWTQESGPATLTFQSPNQLDTNVTFPVAGTYTVKVWAFNGHVTVSDTATLTVLAPDLTTGLVAHYKFDEPSGTTVLDASGRNHLGLITGATRVPGKNGGALRFNGNATYVYVQGNEDLDLPGEGLTGTGLTLATWIKTDRTFVQMVHGYPMPIWRADYAKSTGYALMVTAAETERLGMRVHHLPGSGKKLEVFTGQTLPTAVWMHIATVYDGTAMIMYVNGVAVASNPTGPIAIRNAGDLAMFLGRGVEGLMDDVRIYHRALSRTDVYGLAQGGLDRREPGAEAGPGQVATLLAPTITLAGSGSDDANSGAVLVPTWTQVEGPAASNISDRNSFTPNVTFTTAGTYRFQLAVSDGVLVGRDEVRIEVTDGSVDLATGLVLHYQLDEGSGSLVADSSSYALNATFLGTPKWSDDGKYLGAARMAGNLIASPVPNHMNALTHMTLSLWIKGDRTLQAMTNAWPEAIYHADYATNRGFALMTTVQNTDTFGFRLHTGTGRREVTMDGVTPATWVHIVATYDGTAMRLYRDGVLVNVNVTGAIPLPGVEAPVQIGIGYEGLFDDVRIYDRALSPTEVQALNTGSPLSGNG